MLYIDGSDERHDVGQRNSEERMIVVLPRERIMFAKYTV